MWPFDSDEESEEDEHRCSDYRVVERGNWVHKRGPIVRYDGLVVVFEQEVVVECIECGNRNTGTDMTVTKEKKIPFESVEEVEPNVDSDLRLEPGRGLQVFLDDVEGIDNG